MSEAEKTLLGKQIGELLYEYHCLPDANYRPVVGALSDLVNDALAAFVERVAMLAKSKCGMRGLCDQDARDPEKCGFCEFADHIRSLSGRVGDDRCDDWEREAKP